MKYVRRGVVVMMGMLLLAGCEKVSEIKTEIKLRMVDEEEVVKEIRSQLITIKAGTFMMGSPSSEKKRDGDELQHKVILTQSFKMGKYEVTQKQYQAIMGKNPSKFRGENLPVKRVTWHEAMKFRSKLTELSRKVGVIGDDETYTLPTEAQWEYACRAGTTGAYAGNLDAMAWYNSNSGSKTHEVGEKQSNAWGLYDMHGNVREWCQNRPYRYPSGSATDPKGPTSGSYRVIRGGSWLHYGKRCRSAYRYNFAPFSSYNNLGFRLVLVQ